MNRLGISFNDITTLAYTELLNQKFDRLPIDPLKYKSDDIKIISFQKWAGLAGISVSQLTGDGCLDDGYAVVGLRRGISFILFDESKYVPRMKHTLMHEIGHLRCGHRGHGGVEEIEAHFFASQFLMPNALIKHLKNHYRITPEFLVRCFGVSKEAANKKIGYINQYGIHGNQYDESVVLMFRDYLFERYAKVIEYHTWEDHISGIYGGMDGYAAFAQAENAYLEPE